MSPTPPLPPPDLVELSRALGDPEYAILADGNASAHGPEGTFWVKASGTSLAGARAEDLVRLRTGPVLELLRGEVPPDDAVGAILANARADSWAGAAPSIEAPMHAALLAIDGVRFVGHTHPTAINAITCSVRFEELLGGRIFPEEVVVCGPESVLVPYADPGVPLGRAVRDGVAEFMGRHGTPPRAIYLRNHGFIACGATVAEVLSVTRMSVKAARIRLGAAAAGGLSFLSARDVERIHGRADIRYRRGIMRGN